MLIVWRSLSGDHCLVAVVWWSLSGGRCLVIIVWWPLSGDHCLVVVVWWSLSGGHCLVIVVWWSLLFVMNKFVYVKCLVSENSRQCVAHIYIYIYVVHLNGCLLWLSSAVMLHVPTCCVIRVAGTTGAVITCPLEVIKTRLQSSNGILLNHIYHSSNASRHIHLGLRVPAAQFHICSSCSADAGRSVPSVLQTARSRTASILFCLRSVWQHQTSQNHRCYCFICSITGISGFQVHF